MKEETKLYNIYASYFTGDLYNEENPDYLATTDDFDKWYNSKETQELLLDYKYYNLATDKWEIRIKEHFYIEEVTLRRFK